MTTPSWTIPADPLAAASEAAALASEDKLLAELADVHFARSAEAVGSAPVAAQPIVPPLAVHAVDPDYQAIHAALQAGAIPTFADEPSTASVVAPAALNVASECEAYVAFLTFIQHHKGAGTTVTFMDPDDYAKSVT
jgi:hypothetical protein